MEAVVSNTLPSELIADIFLKLPVKSLCRFKCVSKSCNSLISDPWFIKTHLTTTKYQRLIHSYDGFRCLDLEKSSSDDDRHKFVKLEFDFLRKITIPVTCYRSMLICGSCNGLLCLSKYAVHQRLFFICNPATRECKLLPKSEPLFSVHEAYGFGYVSSIDDYMFVRICWPTKEAHIFSLKNNSWKRVQLFVKLDISPFRLGVPLNGVIHWAIENVKNKLHAFDLVEEKFKTLAQPKSVSVIPHNEYLWSLGVMEDCLCMTFWFTYKRSSEFWIMKEYGIEESWSKIFSFSEGITQPLCLWKKTDSILIVLNGREFVIYDPKEQSFKDFVVDRFKSQVSFNEFSLQVYVESLVSPNFS